MAKKKKSAKISQNPNAAALRRLSKELEVLAEKNFKENKNLSSYLVRTDWIRNAESIPVHAILSLKQSRQKLRRDMRCTPFQAIESFIEKAIISLATKNLKYKFNDVFLDGLLKGTPNGRDQHKLDLLIGVDMPTDKSSYNKDNGGHVGVVGATTVWYYHQEDGSVLMYYQGTGNEAVRYSKEEWENNKWGQWSGKSESYDRNKAKEEDRTADIQKFRFTEPNPLDETSHVNVALLLSISVFRNDAKNILKSIAIRQGGALGVEHEHVNRESVAKLDKMMHGAYTKAILRNLEAQRNKYGQRAKKVRIISKMIFLKSEGYTDPARIEEASIALKVKVK